MPLVITQTADYLFQMCTERLLKMDIIELADDEIEVDGKILKMPDDLKDLPEMDYDDPAVKKQIAAEDAERIRKYGRLTCEEAEYMYARRLELQKTITDKSVEELNKMALEEIRSGQKGH